LSRVSCDQSYAATAGSEEDNPGTRGTGAKQASWPGDAVTERCKKEHSQAGPQERNSEVAGRPRFAACFADDELTDADDEEQQTQRGEGS
jgi:hypothetical protein